MKRGAGITATLIGALCALACGCGSSGVAAPETSNESSRPAEPLAGVQEELAAAGLKTRKAPPSDAQAGIEAGPGERFWVNIAYYADPHQAAVVGEQIKRTFATAQGQGQGQGLVTVEGHLLIDIGSRRPLTAAEKAAFRRIVATLRSAN